DLVEGETLDALRERSGGTLPVKDVMEFAYQATDVLAAAHAVGIVHRDVKPANLLFTPSGLLVLLDFGIARMSEVSDGTLTRAGGMLGTPAFMPPEQVLGRTGEVDARTDLWALGATLFFLLAGVSVHIAETPEELMVISATRFARPLRAAAPHVPPV